MKKLSIEEKAKAYDGLIERLKDLKFAYRFSQLSDTIEEKFPELNEDEGEKIKKEIISFLKEGEPYHCPNSARRQEWAAWLENKCEQNLLDKVAKQVTKDKETATSFLKSTGIMNENGELAEPYRVCVSTSNWSEEDEKAINDIMWIIEAYRKNGFNETHIQIADSSENWLKSLKPQNTWKPSEEQMYILNWVANILLNHDGIVEEEASKKLQSLYNDLKNLMEE